MGIDRSQVLLLFLLFNRVSDYHLEWITLQNKILSRFPDECVALLWQMHYLQSPEVLQTCSFLAEMLKEERKVNSYVIRTAFFIFYLWDVIVCQLFWACVKVPYKYFNYKHKKKNLGIFHVCLSCLSLNLMYLYSTVHIYFAPVLCYHSETFSCAFG